MKGATLVLGAMLMVAVMCGGALALMPPEVYRQRIIESQVKAKAMIQAVDLDQADSRFSTLTVEFKPLDGGPKFIGHCLSTDRAWQQTMPGPQVYFSPVPGQKVYVTLDTDGGDITSLSPLTPELERALDDAPESLVYGAGRVAPPEGGR